MREFGALGEPMPGTLRSLSDIQARAEGYWRMFEYAASREEAERIDPLENGPQAPRYASVSDAYKQCAVYIEEEHRRLRELATSWITEPSKRDDREHFEHYEAPEECARELEAILRKFEGKPREETESLDD